MSKILVIGGCGYIGSVLVPFLRKQGNEITAVDLEWFGNANNAENMKTDIDSLSKDFISTFDAIILLAGHSSVRMCEDNLASTFSNNVRNFVSLLEKTSLQQKFIYASSSSVYGKNAPDFCAEEYTAYQSENPYDFSKYIIDEYSSLSGKHFYGLRFGTVNGPSPLLRVDLMINAMYRSAVEEKEVVVFNKAVRRPILGMNDLCRAIGTILDSRESNSGIYNLASFNSTAGEIAKKVAELTDVPLREAEAPVQPTNAKLHTSVYDFSISTDKFKKTFEFDFKDSIESIVQELKEQYHRCIPSSRHEKRFYP